MNTTTVQALASCNQLPDMLFNQQLIEQLAVQLVTRQVEDLVDCIDECDVQSFEAADRHVKGAIDIVELYLEDVLVEFRDMLYAAVRARKIDLQSVKLTAEGAIDADVVVR